MNRFHSLWIIGVAAAAAAALPPEPAPIAASYPMKGLSQTYLDDVEGLARLAWQATKHPDDALRLAAVEQMARVCAHPRRVDMVLANLEAKEPNGTIRQAALRVRSQLRMETEHMKWVDAEVEKAVGRSLVAHDPVPYREAIAGLREEKPMLPPSAAPMLSFAAPRVDSKPKPNEAQLRWAASMSTSRAANAKNNLPKRGN